MNRTDSSRCLIGLRLVPLEMETSAVNSEYCLSKTMRPHPLTLPTVTPLTVPSVAAQSEQCVRVLNRGWRDSESSCFYTEIVERRRRREGRQSFFIRLYLPLPAVPSPVLKLQDIPDLFCLLHFSFYPLYLSVHRMTLKTSVGPTRRVCMMLTVQA